jgi:uncharacterized membrane protein
MCGFGISQLVEFAIAVIVLLAIIAIIRTAFPTAFIFNFGGPYGNIIRIVVMAAVAIVILLIALRLLQCSGLLPHYGMLTLPLAG